MKELNRDELRNIAGGDGVAQGGIGDCFLTTVLQGSMGDCYPT